MKKIRYQAIEIENYPQGQRTDFWRGLYQDATSCPVRVPFIVARGARNGPVLGVTAAVHGNELNGLRIIQHLLEEVDLARLAGSLVCVPVVNVPSYNAGTRLFPDGLDLNHVFPGKSEGRPAEQYARAFSETLLPCLDYLVDLHTASDGRVNTMYVRVDMKVEVAHQMAVDFNPQIILHGRSGDGTLRSAARRHDIPAVTVEAGNPSVIQGRMVFEGETGIRNIMMGLGMLEGKPSITREPVVCEASRWLRTTSGGLLETRFKLLERVVKRQVLAVTRDPFGKILKEYRCPADGVVIGMAANPAAASGTRYCHLGTIGEGL
ncbi:MAG: succinylglutamate desuccinylase/aspartoacylase family protein [Vulcanimicrobiota bacterium]